MRIAICCPGPSLPARWNESRPGFDYIYAVNRALITVPYADWLSAGDSPMFRGLLADHRPHIGVVTFDDVVTEIRDDPTWSNLQLVGWSDLRERKKHEIHRPLTWSVQAALIHAIELGARHIDLYGCDGAAGGTQKDCTGYIGEDRSADRWAREELDLAVTFQLLSGHDISINRIKP